MGYRLERGEDITEAVQRIAREQIDKALVCVDSGELDASVHEIRKRCKKVRGLIRLVRPGFDDYAGANAAFRDIARPLSMGRDRAVSLATHDALIGRYRAGADPDALAPIRAELERRNRDYQLRAELPARVERATEALRRAREGEVGDWSIDADDGDIAAGLAKTYARARDAMNECLDDASAENLHEWRKRSKYHRYHMRLLRSAWPAVFTALRDEAKRLSDYLGDDHDLAVLRATVMADPDAFGGAETVRTFVALVDGRRRRLQDDSFELGALLFGAGAKPIRKRISAVLDEWRG